MAKAKSNAPHEKELVLGEPFQGLLDGLADQIMVIDASYKLLMANRAVLGGRSRSEVVGRCIFSISWGAELRGCPGSAKFEVVGPGGDYGV